MEPALDSDPVTKSDPAEILVPPVYVFAPASVSVPALTPTPPTPLTTPAIVSVPPDLAYSNNPLFAIFPVLENPPETDNVPMLIVVAPE
jgi:hypothetical protein